MSIKQQTKLEKPKIYIIICEPQTHTAKFLSLFTRDEYNHVAISLTPDLTQMYSFCRRYEHIPIPGGFEQESIVDKTYKKHPTTKIIVLEKTVNYRQYKKIRKTLSEMQKNKWEYKYNLLGLVFANFNKNLHREKTFYCSEFVRDILTKNKIVKNADLPNVCKPYDFYQLNTKSGWNRIFMGTVWQYKQKQMRFVY